MAKVKRTKLSSDVVFAATICLLWCKWNEREVEDKEVKEGNSKMRLRQRHRVK